MSASNNVAIEKEKAVLTMSEIRSETEKFLAETESAYSEIAGLFVKSEGEFITALKEQLNMEQQVVRAICDFFLTLLDMMNAAEADFNKLDRRYARGKMKR